MAKLSNKKSEFSVTPAVIFLNIGIVLVIAIICILAFFHILKNDETVAEENTDTSETEMLAAESESSAEGFSEVPIPSVTEAITAESEPEITSNTLLDTFDEEFFANDLFIGDSISMGLHTYGILPTANVFAEIGLNPESAFTRKVNGYTALEKAQTMQPKRIYVMLGTNGLAFMSESIIIKNMKALCEKLREICPNSQIYLLSIPPVTKANKEGMLLDSVKSYNAELSAAAKAEGVPFIDIYSVLTDDSGYFSSAYAEQDGMHFLAKTYNTFLLFIERKVKND